MALPVPPSWQESRNISDEKAKSSLTHEEAFDLSAALMNSITTLTKLTLATKLSAAELTTALDEHMGALEQLKGAVMALVTEPKQ